MGLSTQEEKEKEKKQEKGKRKKENKKRKIKKKTKKKNRKEKPRKVPESLVKPTPILCHSALESSGILRPPFIQLNIFTLNCSSDICCDSGVQIKINDLF